MRVMACFELEGIAGGEADGPGGGEPFAPLMTSDQAATLSGMTILRIRLPSLVENSSKHPPIYDFK